jgi:NADH-quinone oxidoreductase subunit A
MASALHASTGIVAYLALFSGVGFAFVFVNLLLGRFLRPQNPHAEKQEIYECGEPSIGSSYVQFDLRFYVVALVFIIFDVEVAFLFPWANVFGKVSGLLDPRVSLVQAEGDTLQWTPAAVGAYRELGISTATLPTATSAAQAEQLLRDGQSDASGRLQLAGFRQLMWASAIAVSFFFVVLLVGFAYEWKTGALDWVRAVTEPGTRETGEPRQERPGSRSPVLSA